MTEDSSHIHTQEQCNKTGQYWMQCPNTSLWPCLYAGFLSNEWTMMLDEGNNGKSRGFQTIHDDVIKWKHFPSYWPFVRGIHRSSVNSPRKGQWRGTLMFLFDLHPNTRLSKQSWGWWFETLSCSLWRHCNARSGGKTASRLIYSRSVVYKTMP